ncbi:MAG TPA: hypothetical protein VL361_01630 [Candidatus Limnocylindrales bacterium]|jgi:hypothetical protein|nr:hypothetical protein [Candidatus Limnocylindrales bacterium]
MPELFSGSTPPASFLNPGLLIFLALGYGVAVLLLRELAMRWGCGLWGFFVLGLAYSVFNEGLLAKTSIVEQNLPINQYDHYGYYLGVSWPWMAGIGCWHACASVIFPIAFTHHLFPHASFRAWFHWKTALAIGVALLLLSCAVFLGTSEKRIKGSPGQLVLFLALILFGLAAARLSKQPSRQSNAAGPGLLPLLFGLSVVIPFWGLVALASAKVPLVVFFVALIGIVMVYAWILDRQQWLSPPAFLLFAIGWYLHNVVQALLFIGVASRNPGRALITAIADTALLVFLFHQARLARRLPLRQAI